MYGRPTLPLDQELEERAKGLLESAAYYREQGRQSLQHAEEFFQQARDEATRADEARLASAKLRMLESVREQATEGAEQPEP